MMQRSGYFLVGSKSAGLIKTPSIVVPSVLVQEIISRIPRTNCRVCSVIFVNWRGVKLRASVTKISLRDVGEPAVNAIRLPSRVKENEVASKRSGVLRHNRLPPDGSTRKR